MSGYEWKRSEVQCNGQGCRARLEGEPYLAYKGHDGETIARLRKRAADAGWAFVRSRLNRRRGNDYCPACVWKPRDAVLVTEIDAATYEPLPGAAVTSAVVETADTQTVTVRLPDGATARYEQGSGHSVALPYKTRLVRPGPAGEAATVAAGTEN